MSLGCLMNRHRVCFCAITFVLLLDHAIMCSALYHKVMFSMCLHSQTGDCVGMCNMTRYREFDHVLNTQLCESCLSRHQTTTCSMMLRGGADTSSASIEGLENLPPPAKKRVKELLKGKDEEIKEKDELLKGKDEEIKRLIEEKATSDAMSSGKFGISFDDLDPLSADIVDPLKPPDGQGRTIESYRTCDNVLKRYLIQDVHDLTVAGCKVDGQEGTVRHIGLNECPFTFFNQPHNGLSEGAHVCPLSYQCHKEWEKLHRFRLNLPFTGSLSPNEQKKYNIWFYGYCVNEESCPNGKEGRKDTTSGGKTIVEKNRKVINSGYIHTAPNFILIHHQSKLFDQIPSFILIPFKKTANQLWGWCGEALEFLVIALNPAVFVDIRANSLGRDSYISCEDADVAKAFDVFAEVMSVVLGVVCVDGVESAPEKDNVRAVREALKQDSKFQYLGLGKDRKGLVATVRLDKGRISAPGKQAEVWSCFKAHPSPEPINIMCRSFNAMQTYLYKRGKLNNVKKTCYKTAKAFPSCLEYEGSAQCFLCRAHFKIHDERQYAYLSCEERDRLYSVATLHYRERFFS